MKLADALEAVRPKPALCAIGKVLEVLDGEDQETLRHALDPESGWKHAQISHALSGIGIHVRADAIGAHRRGACTCP